VVRLEDQRYLGDCFVTYANTAYPEQTPTVLEILPPASRYVSIAVVQCEAAATQAPPSPPERIGALLHVVRILLAYGRHLADTVTLRATAPNFPAIAACFGTIDLPIILAPCLGLMYGHVAVVIRIMTKLLDDAVAAVRNLLPAEQDQIARAMLRLTGTDDEPPVTLSADERAAITASKAAAARGEFASDEQVRTTWAKHGL
jgi:hypothetical protein